MPILVYTPPSLPQLIRPFSLHKRIQSRSLELLTNCIAPLLLIFQIIDEGRSAEEIGRMLEKGELGP